MRPILTSEVVRQEIDGARDLYPAHRRTDSPKRDTWVGEGALVSWAGLGTGREKWSGEEPKSKEGIRRNEA